MKKIGFIGAGKVGYSFGKHISEMAGDMYSVAGYYSRDYESARAAAFAGGSAFETAEGLAAECDLLLLTVPDGQIADVWARLSDALPGARAERGKPLHIGHCSGSFDSGLFKKHAGASASAACTYGSIHPLVAIYDKNTAYKNLNGAYFTIEGDGGFQDFAKALLVAAGNPYDIIDSSQKTLYHAACVMVSNLVCAIAYEGQQALEDCGLDPGFAGNAWRDLFLRNAENVDKLGPVLALTGPVERGDAATVARHLNILTGDTRTSYLSLSRKLVEAARRKNPDRDYSALESLLRGNAVTGR